MNGIKHIRSQLGMTQTEFAKSIGAVQSSVCAFERGQQDVRPHVARRVAELVVSRGFECTMDDVYSEAPVLRSKPARTRKARAEVSA